VEKKKKIIIIGAGPGGLSAAMLLSHRGFDVTVYEKDGQVGGRSQSYEMGGYLFDAGPTFLLMKFILDEVFSESGAHVEDYMKCTRLDPMYKIYFQDLVFELTDDTQLMQERIEKTFGEGEGFLKFINREKKRFWKMFPCLQKPYGSVKDFFDWNLIKALPHLSLGRSMYDELGLYFKDERLKMSFTFHSKYIGMSPWECPAYFMILPYMEHAFGIYHVEGGLAQIAKGMAKVAEENGAKIHLNTPVKELIIENKTVRGVMLENGETVHADETIINADFAYAMTALAKGKTKKYTPEKLAKKQYSCSTLMFHWGLDGILDLPHHSFFPSKDYKQFTHTLFKEFKVSPDISFYVRNASVTDSTLAPSGKSSLYILVPVPNNLSKIDWEKDKKQYRDLVLSILEKRLGIKNLEKRIEVEKIVTPQDWQEDHNVYLGATFSMAHTVNQMIYFRPHNKFEEFEHCYLVGGGTHPGSGLPTIWESARITSNLISKTHKVPFASHNLHV